MPNAFDGAVASLHRFRCGVSEEAIFTAPPGAPIPVRIVWVWNDPEIRLAGLQTSSRNGARRAEVQQSAIPKPRPKVDTLAVAGGPAKVIQDVQEDEQRTVYRLDLGS